MILTQGRVSRDVFKVKDEMIVEFFDACRAVTSAYGRGFVNRAMGPGRRWRRGLSVEMTQLFPPAMIVDTVDHVRDEDSMNNFPYGFVQTLGSNTTIIP